MSDNVTPKNQNPATPAPPDTPDAQPKATADASAPNADPQGTTDAVAQPADPAISGSQTESTAGQEGQATLRGALANLVAQHQREGDTALEMTDSWGRDAWTDPDVEKHPAVRVIREQFPHAHRRYRPLPRRDDDPRPAPSALRDICATLRDDPAHPARLPQRPDRGGHAPPALDAALRCRRPALLAAEPGPPPPEGRLSTTASPCPRWFPSGTGRTGWSGKRYDMFGIVFDGHPNLRRILLAGRLGRRIPAAQGLPAARLERVPGLQHRARVVPRSRTRWTGRGE